MMNDLLLTISNELNILRSNDESFDSWSSRVIYSAVGHIAIASLYDIQEDGQPVSIVHFKNRITNLFSCYKSIYPQLQNIDRDEIYELMLQTGYVYHFSERLIAPVYKVSKVGNIKFIRGNKLCDSVFRSGLGAYTINDYDEDITEFALMFGLSRMTLTEYWEKLTSNIKWHEENFLTVTQYLRMEPPFTYGYFMNSPYKDGRISLMRTGFNGAFLYYLYHYEGEKLFVKQVPSWKDSRLISNACINSTGNLPPTIYEVDSDKHIVKLTLQYLFPKAELNLIKLYSWPGKNIFNYIMSYPVFVSIKQEFERMGYKFTER